MNTLQRIWLLFLFIVFRDLLLNQICLSHLGPAHSLGAALGRSDKIGARAKPIALVDIDEWNRGRRSGPKTEIEALPYADTQKMI
jgi:hypothetical protein